MIFGVEELNGHHCQESLGQRRRRLSKVVRTMVTEHLGDTLCHLQDWLGKEPRILTHCVQTSQVAIDQTQALGSLLRSFVTLLWGSFLPISSWPRMGP